MGMHINVSLPEIANVNIYVSGKYSTDILDDMKSRAIAVFNEAVLGYQVAMLHAASDAVELDSGQVQVGE